MGFDYAALLVDPGYHPPPTMDIAPTPGGAVIAVAIVKEPAPRPSLHKILNVQRL